jgi:hypothetical protein
MHAYNTICYEPSQLFGVEFQDIMQFLRSSLCTAILPYRTYFNVLILWASRKFPGIPTIERLFVLPNEIMSKCVSIDDYGDEIALLATESPYTNLSATAVGLLFADCW